MELNFPVLLNDAKHSETVCTWEHSGKFFFYFNQNGRNVNRGGENFRFILHGWKIFMKISKNFSFFEWRFLKISKFRVKWRECLRCANQEAFEFWS